MEKSYFDGGVVELLLYNILIALATVFTLGIAYPWAMCMLERWKAEHTVVDGHRLVFEGRGGQFLGRWMLYMIAPLGILIVAAVLSIVLAITLIGPILIGIALLVGGVLYGPFVTLQVQKWITEQTHFQCKPAYACSPSGAAQPAPDREIGYVPETAARSQRTVEPSLLDKLVPVDSFREKALPFVCAALSFSVVLSVLIVLFA